jgi:hypothetical protein
MLTFTEQDITDLISCRKEVIDPPRREMKIEGKMKRNEMTLRSSDNKHEFRVFMRQSEEFQENFSIGLDYLPHEDPGEFNLIRYNGQHGGTKVFPHHAVYHIHRMRAEDINAGKKAPRAIERTEEYASFTEALRIFCNHINLDSADQHFPGLVQRSLFPGENAGRMISFEEE